MTDRRLLHDLSLVLVIKLLLLATLWWIFIRDQRVTVDAERAAHAIAGSAPLDSAVPPTPDMQGLRDGH